MILKQGIQRVKMIYLQNLFETSITNYYSHGNFSFQTNNEMSSKNCYDALQKSFPLLNFT